jgi:predicted transcriptional regulator
MAPPEASRHLTWLTAQGLLQRHPDGTFRLTGYGLLIAEGVASFEGLRSRQEFLRTHDLTVLPREFVSRLYELSGTAVGSNFSDSLRHVEMVLGEAREFAWFLSDQAILTPEILLGSMRKSRVSVRVLLQSSVLPPFGRRVTPIPRDIPLEVRVLPEVGLGLALNEKIAGVCFAGLPGPIDYASGFQGSSAGFRTWCEDLFNHCWKRGRTIRVW